jgi:hypothetical protein
MYRGKEGKYGQYTLYFIYTYENRTMKPVEIILRRGMRNEGE